MNSYWSNFHGTSRTDEASEAYYRARYHQYWASYWWNMHQTAQHGTIGTNYDGTLPYMGCECDDRHYIDTCECYHGNSSNPSDWHCFGYKGGAGLANAGVDDQARQSHYMPHVSHEEVHDKNMDVDQEDNEELELEVNEEFRKFLEESARHRKERDKAKKAIAKEACHYVEVGSHQLNTSTLPPSEQPGLKRKEHMDQLYGAKSSLIMSLEAAAQLRYDRNFDTRQPVYWPSIPLKF